MCPCQHKHEGPHPAAARPSRARSAALMWFFCRARREHLRGGGCPGGGGSTAAAATGLTQSPALLSSPPPRPCCFASLWQGGLIHELSLGSPLSWVTQSTGSVQASLAEINVSTHLLFVCGSSPLPKLPLQSKHRLTGPRPHPCPFSGCHQSGQASRDAVQVPPATSD